MHISKKSMSRDDGPTTKRLHFNYNNAAQRQFPPTGFVFFGGGSVDRVGKSINDVEQANGRCWTTNARLEKKEKIRYDNYINA